MGDLSSAPDQVIRCALDAKVPAVCRTCHLCHAIQCTDNVRTCQRLSAAATVRWIAHMDPIPLEKAAFAGAMEAAGIEPAQGSSRAGRSVRARDLSFGRASRSERPRDGGCRAF